MDSYELQSKLSSEVRQQLILDSQREQNIAQYREARSLLSKRILEMCAGIVVPLVICIFVWGANLWLLLYVFLASAVLAVFIPRYKEPSLLMLCLNIKAKKKQIGNWNHIIEVAKIAKK